MAKAKPNNYQERAQAFDQAGDTFGYGPLSNREFGEEDPLDSGLAGRYSANSDQSSDTDEGDAGRGYVTDHRMSMARGHRRMKMPSK